MPKADPMGSKSAGTGVETMDERKTMLLEDPDPLLRWSIENHLGQWFEIVPASTPEDAELLLRGSKFDAVVLSATFEGQTRELEAKVRARNPKAVIVRLVTDRESESKDPSVTCMEKPFRLEALARTLGVGATSRS